MSQAQSCLLSSTPELTVRKQRSRAPHKNPKLLHYRSMKRGGERRVLLQHSEEEFVKFPERTLGDLGQRKMLRLCICSSCASQESLALHPKLFQFLISLSLSPTHQASQNVIQLSKATTYHNAEMFAPSCSVSVPDSLHLSFLFLILISPTDTICKGGLLLLHSLAPCIPSTSQHLENTLGL